VTVLVALLFVAATALRGYLPGVEPASRDPKGDDPTAVAVVVVLLLAAVAVMAVAVITRLRNRTAIPPRVAGRADWLRGDRGRPTWRVALIAFGLILGWLMLSILIGRLGGGQPEDSSIPGAVPSAADATPGDRGSPAEPPQQVDSGSHLPGYFYGATLLFLGVIVAGSVVAASRRRRPVSSTDVEIADGDATPDDGSGSESLARAAEVGLAEVGDLSREPRRAIIACYAAMERQLSLLPDAAPRDFDTASEVLARAVDHHALAPDSASQLVDLFDEARFSPHVMNEGHRDAAVAVLTQVLGELRSRA
jgi:hypothetical protein